MTTPKNVNLVLPIDISSDGLTYYSNHLSLSNKNYFYIVEKTLQLYQNIIDRTC